MKGGRKRRNRSGVYLEGGDEGALALAVGHIVEEGLHAGRGRDHLAGGFWRAIGLQVKARLLHLSGERSERSGQLAASHKTTSGFWVSYELMQYAAPTFVRRVRM